MKILIADPISKRGVELLRANKAFQVDENVGLKEDAILVPVVSLLGVLIPSIGGLGVREGGTLLFLAPLGIQPGEAILVGFLWTLAQVAANLSGVFFYLFGRFERFRAAEAADEGDSSEMDSDEATGESEVFAKNMEVRSDGPVGDHPDQGRAGKSATAT